MYNTISWVDGMIRSTSRLMVGPAGRQRDRSGKAERAWLGVGQSGSVAQVGTLGPGKLQESLLEGEGTPTADDYTGGLLWRSGAAGRQCHLKRTDQAQMKASGDAVD